MRACEHHWTQKADPDDHLAWETVCEALGEVLTVETPKRRRVVIVLVLKSGENPESPAFE